MKDDLLPLCSLLNPFMGLRVLGFHEPLSLFTDVVCTKKKVERERERAAIEHSQDKCIGESLQ